MSWCGPACVPWVVVIFSVGVDGGCDGVVVESVKVSVVLYVWAAGSTTPRWSVMSLYFGRLAESLPEPAEIRLFVTSHTPHPSVVVRLECVVVHGRRRLLWA